MSELAAILFRGSGTCLKEQRMNALPLTSKRIAKSIGVRTVGAVVYILLAAGCERTPSAASSPEAGRPKDSVTAGSPADAAPMTAAASGYTVLAANLADPFLKNRDQPAPSKELAQLFAEANIKIVRYQSISTNDPMLRRIAAEAADSGVKMLESHQVLNEMEQDDGLTDILIGGLGLYLGDPTTILHGAGSVLRKGDAKQQERIKWGSAFNRSRAAQLMLPEAAKAYAGATSGGADAVAIDFDESFAGSADHDFIAMRNVSGGALSNCTVLVELMGQNGKVCQNIHFDPVWERDGQRFARYGIGVESDSGIYGRRTVHGVELVRVSLWSDELRQEAITYVYKGGEKAKDVRTLLDGKMKIEMRYVHAPFTFIDSRAVLNLAGVPMIPAHKLTLTVTPSVGGDGAPPIVFNWDQPEWMAGYPQVMSLGGAVTAKPRSARVDVNFPGIEYQFSADVIIK